MNINPNEMITTPLRLMEVFAQGLRETIEKADAACSDVPRDNYGEGFRDGLLMVLSGFEKLILSVREREVSR